MGNPTVLIFHITGIWLDSHFPMGRSSVMNKVCDFSCSPLYYGWHLSCRLGRFQLWPGSFTFSRTREPGLCGRGSSLWHGWLYSRFGFLSFSKFSTVNLASTLESSSLEEVMEMWNRATEKTRSSFCVASIGMGSFIHTSFHVNDAKMLILPPLCIWKIWSSKSTRCSQSAS